MEKTLDKEGLIEDVDLREKYAAEYDELSNRHNRLGKIVHQDIQKLLEDANIDVLSVTHRTKDFDKFLEKIRRKKYNNPLKEIEDICGLRIVCYYTSDLDKIESMIKKEFDVLFTVDKSKLLDEDEFSYLSRHYIVKLKQSWLNTPSYRDLGDLKAEIQLRTLLMHAWADISHKLAYKKKEQAPPQFMRQLNSLSAILENADTQFNKLKNDRENYINELVWNSAESGENKDTSMFDLNQELNLDSLQTFLDFYIPDRKKDIGLTADLLDEIIGYNKKYGKNISFKLILDAYNKSKEYLEVEEVRQFYKMDLNEVLKIKENNPNKFEEKVKSSKFFVQVGIVRAVLGECYNKFDDYSLTRENK